MGGGIEGELKTNRLLILPIKFPTPNEERKFETLYNERQKDLNIDKLINNSIYEMYNLSELEILYIEKKRND